jgi:hypothetical protein
MATWYDSAWKYRIPLSVDNSAGGTGTYSFSLTIPRDLDHFWDYVQADGDDIILTDPDGFTTLTAANATAVDIDDGSGGAFSGSTRAGRIRVDKFTGGVAGSSCFMWLYYGNSAATVSSDFGAWSTPTTVTCRAARQGGQRVTPRIATRPEDNGATRPRTTIVKTSTGTQHLYWDFAQELNLRDEIYEGSLWYEGISSCILSAEIATVSAPTVVTATQVLLLGRRGSVVHTIHPAGASGSDYTIKLKATTTQGRVLDRRVVLSVFDTVETG